MMSVLRIKNQKPKRHGEVTVAASRSQVGLLMRVRQRWPAEARIVVVDMLGNVSFRGLNEERFEIRGFLNHAQHFEISVE